MTSSNKILGKFPPPEMKSWLSPWSQRRFRGVCNKTYGPIHPLENNVDDDNLLRLNP